MWESAVLQNIHEQNQFRHTNVSASFRCSNVNSLSLFSIYIVTFNLTAVVQSTTSRTILLCIRIANTTDEV